MKGFDLGELLAAEVSKLDTSAGKDRYELIDIDLLDPDPENFYSMDGLEQLKENILLCGLLQPLRVKLSTEPGRYTVIAGHRRREAIRRLVDDGHKMLAKLLVTDLDDKRELTAAEANSMRYLTQSLKMQLRYKDVSKLDTSEVEEV